MSVLAFVELIMCMKGFTSRKKCENFDFVTTYVFLHRGILVSKILGNEMKNYTDNAKWLALLNKDHFAQEKTGVKI